jgi:hypothetical protein
MLLSLSFFLCSVSLLRMNSEIFEMFEEKTIFFKLSFKWDGGVYTKISEIGRVVKNLSAVDAYPGMNLCTPINLALVGIYMLLRNLSKSTSNKFIIAA